MQLEGQEALQADKAYYRELEKENEVLRAERNERDVLRAKNEGASYSPMQRVMRLICDT